MKSIKVIMLLALMFASTSIFAQNDQNNKERKHLTVEEKIEKIKTDLSLTEKQVKELKTLLLNREQQIQKAKTDKNEAMKTVKEDKDNFDKSIQSILTPEQYAKFKTMFEKSHKSEFKCTGDCEHCKKTDCKRRAKPEKK